VPIIGDGNALPFVQALDLNLSGRYDDYSDFGSTKNPKIALSWKINDWIKARGNYAKSFVAPAFTSIGSGGGVTGESGYGAFGQGAVNVPIAAYANATQLPGCATATTTCTIGTTLTGIQLSGGNDQLQPQHGESWAVGVDFASPPFLPGLRAGITYWNSKLTGGITAPAPSFAVNAAGLNSLLTIYPNGATPAQIAAAAGSLPLTSAVPSTVYFIYDFRQRNALNLNISGLDIDASYRFTTDVGQFDLGGSVSEKLKFDQNVGGGANFDVLNTTGFNTTFPSVKRTARANLGWSLNQWSADAFVNYTGSYYNWSSTTQTPITRNAGGLPTGGGDKVKAYTTIDLHIAYDVKSDGFLNGLQLFADGTNILDKDPPFYNSTSGYDNFSASPIGRLIAVGFRAKY
jgi:iron complex outermembrane receptor protein